MRKDPQNRFPIDAGRGCRRGDGSALIRIIRGKFYESEVLWSAPSGCGQEMIALTKRVRMPRSTGLAAYGFARAQPSETWFFLVKSDGHESPGMAPLCRRQFFPRRPVLVGGDVTA